MTSAPESQKCLKIERHSPFVHGKVTRLTFCLFGKLTNSLLRSLVPFSQLASPLWSGIDDLDTVSVGGCTYAKYRVDGVCVADRRRLGPVRRVVIFRREA